MTPLFAELSPRITSWLTPVWIGGMGILLGLLILGVLWAITYGFSFLGGRFKKVSDELPGIVMEGALWPITIISTIAATLGIVCYMGAYEDGRMMVLQSIPQIPSALGPNTVAEWEIPKQNTGEEFPQTKVEASFDSARLRRIQFESNEEVIISPVEVSALTMQSTISVEPGKPFVLDRSPGRVPFGGAIVDHFFVVNRGAGPATLRMTIAKSPYVVEAMTVGYFALGVVVIYLVYVLQSLLFPKLSAIALATYKSNINQTLFLVIAFIGVIMLLSLIVIPYNTFGDDIKMVKVTSLSSIRVLALILAIWCASTSVSEEIEGRTALTVLSKPIDRRSFVLGKFVGISWVLAVLFLLFSFVFLIVLAYKPIYDAKESTMGVPPWPQCHAEMISVIPGLILTFMESLVLVALSVMISTRLPMMVNFVLCFAIYALGHLTPLIVQSSTAGFDIVRFFASLVAVVVPNLDHFDVEAAVHADVAIPIGYMVYSLLYSTIYSAAAMILALLMFEDRDLT